MPDTFTTLTESEFDQRIIENAAGVRVSVLANGCLQWIMVGPTMINLFVAHPLGGGPMRLLIRKHDGEDTEVFEVVGPNARARVTANDRLIRWEGTRLPLNSLRYRVELMLHPTEAAWAWRVELDATDTLHAAGQYDAILVQDVGLAGRGQVQNNEAYTSQYLDHQIFDHPEFGQWIATRQNLPQHGNEHTWLAHACVPGGAGALTDAFDFFGPAFRAEDDDVSPRHAAARVLPTANRQYECAAHVLQSRSVHVTADDKRSILFVARFVADHPEPSASADAKLVEHDLNHGVWNAPADAELTAFGPVADGEDMLPPLLNGQTLADAQLRDRFGNSDLWREVEKIGGELGSFFCDDDTHVVLRHKELSVDRRHAHLLVAGHERLPGGQTLCNTAYASGIFASHVCLGNTSFNKLLSVSRDPLNLCRFSGLRLFIRSVGGDDWIQLGTASAFVMRPERCDWVYQLAEGRRITVQCEAVAGDPPRLRFAIDTHGLSLDLRMSAHLVMGDREHEQSCRVLLDAKAGRVDLTGPGGLMGERYPDASWSITLDPPPRALSGDELFQPEGQRHGWPYVGAEWHGIERVGWEISGTLGEVAAGHDELADRVEVGSASLRPVLSGGEAAGVARLNMALPWFDHNAAIHLTAPHGIEQYGGAAWGVRDVCQGPVEWLLARGEPDTVARILEDVFSHQYEHSGAWPQWYMHPPFENIQSPHSHGDVAVWPVIATVNYLAATGDVALLDKSVPFTQGDAPFAFTDTTATIREHVEFAIEKLVEKFVPGTALLAYGDGDWNDSLQPARPEMRESMVSTWTAELFYQALRGWAQAMRRVGDEAAAAKHGATADAIRNDFKKLLVLDDETVGLYMHHDDPAKSQVLLHPRDTATGVKHRLLPMIRGIISGIFTPEQARHHAELIHTHLLAPDGARLMDRPPKYTGGTMTHFQRLESASFFGREIGLMYTHAHLRYAEAMAKLGEGQKLFEALLTICPVGLEHTVPNASPRQANCYFSSSDAAFLNRADSEERYDELMRGNVPVNGGWRVYSSGPGIAIGLIVRQWLGLRRDYDRLVFDPVLSVEHDGLVATVSLLGESCEVTCHVSGEAQGVQRVALDGETIDAVGRDDNPYRVGGLCVDVKSFGKRLKSSQKRIEVWC